MAHLTPEEREKNKQHVRDMLRSNPMTKEELKEYKKWARGLTIRHYLFCHIWLPIFKFVLWGMGESYAESLCHYMDLTYKDKKARISSDT
jgi:hypothetical protein